MDQAIYEKLKHTPELVPAEHDGSYELVRSIVAAYRDVDESVLDYHDLNAIYLLCIGTWRHGYDKKQEVIQASHLSAAHKGELCELVDTLKRRAEAGAYSNHGSNIGQQGDLGMFGTGFYSFQKKTDVKSVQAFIRMCIDLLDMTEDEEMFQRVARVCTKSFHGMKAASASVILHCLKPYTFPVLNSNHGSEDIYSALGIPLESREKLETYIDNCRKIKAFRDANFSFKNYQIMDMAAWELTSDPMQRILSQYKESFDAWFPEEMYKWRAVQCFQDHWRLEAPDFSEMLQDSLAQASNLLDTNYSYPTKMITYFAEKEPNTVREMFRQLLDFDVDLVERIHAFEQTADTLLIRYKSKESMKQHFQTDRTVCTYLFFTRPEQSFLYQYGKCKAFLKEIGSSAPCKMGDTQNVITYHKVATQVLRHVEQDDELLHKEQEMLQALGKEYYADAAHHLLTDDIIYFGSRLHKEDYWPALTDYDPEISAKQWNVLLADPAICTEENRQTLQHMRQLGGEATCTQLSIRFGNTAAHYNSSLVQLARRVYEKTGCPLVQNEKENQKWWPILFIGRSTLKGQPGTYSWKLREELEDALRSLPMKEGDPTVSFAKNTILFGPPGTGKTYQTANYAVAIIEGKSLKEIQAEDHEKVLERYRQYRQDNRIEFTTFHQSFGYEDFIEGIRPKFLGENEEEATGEIQYEIAKGVFKAFCQKAQVTVTDTQQTLYGFSDAPSIWKVSLASTGENALRTYCMDHDCIRIGWDEYGESVTDETNYSVGGKNVLNAFYNRMQVGDIVLSCYSARTIDAIGVVTGDPEWLPTEERYRRCRNVKWLLKGKQIDIEEFRLSRALVQSTVYQLDTTAAEVIKVLEKNGFASTHAVKSKPYVFIIDEINRGNISKIFGELITLIEPSKRLGQSEELQVRLPYSQKLFGIPDNVYLLGTMNTADRSIALLDTALRRRFSFVEMMPDSSVLEGIQVEGISIPQLLTTLNRRIEVLFDREHTLGHAFFTPLRRSPTLQTLGGIFRDRIVPLLQEYFYDDYDKVRLILGDKKRPTERRFFQEVPVDPQALFGTGLDFEIAPAYRINRDAFYNVEVYRDL